VEVFHGLANKIPFALERYNIRSVVTIHDLRFMRNVETQNPLKTLYYKITYSSTCRRADRIVTISEFAKQEIVEHLNVDPDKIDVIYMGCHKRFLDSVTPEHSDMIRKKYNLPDNYVLSVGSVTENSNIEVIIEALAKSQKPIDLVIAGRATSHINKLKKLTAQHNVTSRTHLLHGVAAEDMPALYANAIAYLSTSRYDGFNYHIVEALNMGTAVIATTGTSHEEAAGPDSIYVSGEDGDALIEAIERVAMDRELREMMAAKGKEYAQRFRPEVIAYNVLKCYNRVGIEIKE
jgi:glycosyltransferase involved in cell wall biosynthesis